MPTKALTDAEQQSIDAAFTEVEELTKANAKGKSHKAKGVQDLPKVVVPTCQRIFQKNYFREIKAGNPFKVYSCSWSGDSSTVVAACQNGTIVTINAQEDVMSKNPIMYPFVMTTAVSLDGKMIAGGGMDNCVRIFDSSGSTPEVKKVLKDPDLEAGSHDGYIAEMTFLDGDKLLTGSGDGWIKKWDLNKGALEQTWKGHIGDVTGCSVENPSSQIFGTSSTDKTLRVWDMRQQYAVRKFQAKYSTNCCAMMPGSKGIMGGCDNASYEFWDVGSNSQIARGKVKKGRCESIAISKSGRFAYLGWDNMDNGLVVVDSFIPDNYKKVEGHTDTVKGVSVSPDGSALATASFDGSVRIWAA